MKIKQTILISVPIIPEFLYDINHPDAPLDMVLQSTTPPSTTTPYPPCEPRQEITDDNLSTTISPTDYLGMFCSVNSLNLSIQGFICR